MHAIKSLRINEFKCQAGKYDEEDFLAKEVNHGFQRFPYFRWRLQDRYKQALFFTGAVACTVCTFSW